MESWSFPFSCDVGRSHTPNKRVLNFIRYGEPGRKQSLTDPVERRLVWLFGEVSKLRRAKSKALALHIKKWNMESRSFPSSFDIAGRYAKHQ